MTELFGRLAPGADLDAARAELRAIHGAMMKEHAEAYPANADFRIDAVLLRDQITSSARTVLLVLLAASALVFVIACSNVANLILARSVRREGELAIRAALGREPAARCGGRCLPRACCCAAPARSLGVRWRGRWWRYWRDTPRASRYARSTSPSTPALLWVGVALALVGRRAAGVRSAPAVGRRGERHSRLSSGSVRITAGHEPAAASLCDDPDRRVVRAAGRRRHAADDADRAPGDADRIQTRATCSRSTCP